MTTGDPRGRDETTLQGEAAAVARAELPPAPDAVRTVFGPYEPVAARYAEALATTGITHGLIGPREIERVWDRHVLNCAVVASLIPDEATVVDVGSGAGLPGLALAIARPDVTMYLVEPMARRIAWLDDTIARLGLPNVSTRRGRADEVDVSGTVVTARAVAKLSTLAQWTAAVADEGALLLALKGASAQAELDRDRKAAARVGWTDLEVLTVGEEVVDPPTTVVRGVYRPRRSRTKKGRH